MAKPPGVQREYHYGYWGNYVPLEVLDNTLKIARSANDQAHAHFLIAMTLEREAVTALEKRGLDKVVIRTSCLAKLMGCRSYCGNGERTYPPISDELQKLFDLAWRESEDSREDEETVVSFKPVFNALTKLGIDLKQYSPPENREDANAALIREIGNALTPLRYKIGELERSAQDIHAVLSNNLSKQDQILANLDSLATELASGKEALLARRCWFQRRSRSS
jgi:hypothetical protein